MPKFAVFFSDGAGFGIEVMQALGAAHAQDIALAQHPQGRMSTVMALVTSQNPTFTFTGAWGFMSTWIGLLSSTLTWIGWALRTCTSTGVLLLTLRLIGIVSTTFTARLRGVQSEPPLACSAPP